MTLLKYLMMTSYKSDNERFFTGIYLLCLGCLAAFVITAVVTAGRTLDQIEKTIDQQNYVLEQLMK